MPKFHLATSGAKDLASTDGEIAYIKAITAKVRADEAEKREAQRKRSIAMGLPGEAADGKLLVCRLWGLDGWVAGRVVGEVCFTG